MVLVNTSKGIKEIPYYTLDDFQSFKRRVAIEERILPKYLYLTVGDEKIPYDSESLIDLSKEFEDEGSFLNFYSKVKDKWSNLSPLEIIPIFLLYNKSKVPAFYIQTEVDSLFGERYFEVENFLLHEKKRFEEEIKKKFRETEKESREWSIDVEKFDTLQENKFTAFEGDKITLEIETNIKNYEIKGIFDRINISQSIPFCSLDNYFKIFKEFNPSLNWNVSLPDVILLQVKSTSDTFTEAWGYIENNTLFFRVKILLSEEDKIKNVISLIYSSIPSLEIQTINEVKKDIGGIVLYPNKSFNNYIFSDLVLNNSIFSNFMYIDESVKATKARVGLNIHFFDKSKPEIGILSVSISDRKTDRSNPETRNKDRNIFPYDSNYIRAKILRAKNAEAVNFFSSTFGKLLSLYGENEKEIGDFYKKYIPSFTFKKAGKVIGRQTVMLKDIVPELFISNYSRRCQHPPIIPSESELKELDKDVQVMYFPQTDKNPGPNKPTIPDPEKRPYVCLDKEYPYPGLNENKLENKVRFPYLPCCFKNDQRIKPNSNFKIYYFGEESDKNLNQQRILRTNKILDLDKFGALPKNLENLFNIWDEEYEYLRKGVSRGKNSFLECIVEIVDPEFQKLDGGDKTDKIRDIRERLLENGNIGLCKQSLYDYSEDEISQQIVDNDVYFDPLLFGDFISKVYNVNIYYFVRKDEEAFLTLPRHTDGYYRYSHDSSLKTVIIYIHFGTEASGSTFPQCEIIVRWDAKNNEIKYDHSEPINGEVEKLFQDVRKTYIVKGKSSRLLEDSILPERIKGRISGQYFDDYGKVRCLRVGTDLYLYTDPLPPLDVNTFENDTISSFGKVEDLVTIDRTVVVDDRIKEIYGRVENLRVLARVNSKVESSQYPPSGQLFSLIKDSQLKKYILYSRLARYIQEYCFYLYSHYLLSSDKGSIDSFFKKKVVLRENFNYSIPPSIFTLENNGILRSGKLVVDSERMIEGLKYSLHLFEKRDKDRLINYHSLISIPNYYLSLEDFTKGSDEVILYGEDSVPKWLIEKQLNYSLTSIPLSGHNPYFFSNKVLGNTIYLAQNVFGKISERINYSSEIYKIWKRGNFNIRETKIKSRFPLKIYFFISPDDIRLYHSSDEDGILLCHQIPLGGSLGENSLEKYQYTVLLPIIG